jgi:hypothetical protein
MPLILGAQSAVGAAEVVTNSCRFNDGDSASLSRAANASANQRLFTYSLWVKPSSTTGGNLITFRESSARYCRSFFESGKLCIKQSYDASTEADVKTTALYRDPSAWMHVVIAVDTAQGTDTNRIKMYVNGTQITIFSTTTWPALNLDLVTRTTSYVGQSGDADNYFDGYMAEVCYIDGTAYAASDFGEFDSDSPTIWKPKDVSGLTFGTTGFYLDFEDSANLGNDANGGTDLTETNLTASDQCTDTPVNNFATYNALQNVPSTTLSEGNTTIVNDSSAFIRPMLSTLGASAGKFYAEFKAVTASSASRIGICAMDKFVLTEYTGVNALSYGYIADGTVANNNSTTISGLSSYTSGDIIGVYIDLDNNFLYFAKNGVLENSGVPTSGATGTGGQAITANNTYGFHITVANSGSYKTSANFGNPSFAITSGNADGNGYGNFEYAPPSGYLALCTKNLGSDGG